MKKTIFLILFTTAFLFCHAQMKFGFTAGVQFASVKVVDVATDNRFAFNTGFVGRAPLAEGIDIHVQLVLSGKGYKYYDSYGYKNLMRPLYLEVPLVARFKFNTSNETKVFLGAGGYFAYGIGGNQTYYPSGYEETEKLRFGSDYSDHLKQTDSGLSFQFGAEFRENYEGHLFYDMGLTKIIPNTTGNAFNRVFGFNLTWYFK